VGWAQGGYEATAMRHAAVGERRVCGCGRVGKMIPPISVTYIHQLTDKYKRAHNGSPAPHRFIGGATSPTNILVYSSVMWSTDEYMGPVKVKPDCDRTTSGRGSSPG
jgi:hypothetical protein